MKKSKLLEVFNQHKLLKNRKSRIATQNSKVAFLLGVVDGGTIKNVTQKIYKAILQLKNEYLYWPN